MRGDRYRSSGRWTSGLVLLAGGLVACGPRTIQPVDLAPGVDTVRVVVDGSRHEGVLEEIEADRLRLTVASGESREFSISELRRLEVRVEKTRGQQVRQGILIGGVAGLVIGGIAGAISTESSACDDGGWFCELEELGDEAEGTGLGALIGLAAGGALGAGIGTATGPGRAWLRVDLDGPIAPSAEVPVDDPTVVTRPARPRAGAPR